MLWIKKISKKLKIKLELKILNENKIASNTVGYQLNPPLIFPKTKTKDCRLNLVTVTSCGRDMIKFSSVRHVISRGAEERRDIKHKHD